MDQKKKLSYVVGAVVVVVLGVAVFGASSGLQKGSLRQGVGSAPVVGCYGSNETQCRSAGATCDWVAVANNTIRSYCVDKGTTCTYTPPAIGLRLNTSPLSINPDSNQKANVNVVTSSAAQITFQVLDSTNTVVNTSEFPLYAATAGYGVEWDGKDNNGTNVAEGRYTFKVTAVSGNRREEQTATMDVTRTALELRYVTTPQANANPDTAQEAEVRFNMTKATTARIYIYNSSNTVVTYFDRPLSAGYNTVKWDGRNSSNAGVPAGSYVMKIQYGSATQFQNVGIGVQRTGLQIGNYYVSPESFDNASSQTTQIKFTLNRAAVVQAKIFRADYRGRLEEVKNLVPSGSNSNFGADREVAITWNGTDNQENRVAPGRYRYRVNADILLQPASDTSSHAVVEGEVLVAQVCQSIAVTSRQQNDSFGNRSFHTVSATPSTYTGNFTWTLANGGRATLNYDNNIPNRRGVNVEFSGTPSGNESLTVVSEDGRCRKVINAQSGADMGNQPAPAAAPAASPPPTYTQATTQVPTFTLKEGTNDSAQSFPAQKPARPPKRK